MQTGVHKSAIEAVRTTVSAEGLLGMYRGFGITIFREIPFAFIQFPIYEQLKVFSSCIVGLGACDIGLRCRYPMLNTEIKPSTLSKLLCADL
jgi:hypothetical protein